MGIEFSIFHRSAGENVESVSNENLQESQSFFTKFCPPIFRRKRRLSEISDGQEEEEDSNTHRSKLIRLDASTATDSLPAHQNIATQADVLSSENSTQTDTVKQYVKPQDSDCHISSTTNSDWVNFPFLQHPQTVQQVQISKTMLIMRGLPGSGKSYLVKQIKTKYPQCVSCSADDFFMQNGEYIFKSGQIKDAHAYSQSTCEEYCRNGESLIVVDNTNIKRWELSAYLNFALKYRYLVLLVEPKTPWKFDLQQLVYRNKHSVNSDIIKRRLQEYETIIPRYLGWFLSRGDSISLLQKSYEILLRCLLFSKEFFDDFSKFSGCDSLDEMLSFYTRNNFIGASKDVIHITTKFFRSNKKSSEFFDVDRYEKYLGFTERISIGGFCVTKNTFGAKVVLSKEQTDVWEQNDCEVIRPDEGAGGHHHGNGHVKPVVVDQDEPYNKELHSSLATNTKKVYSQDLKKQRGRRAHFSLGASGDTRPVQTGLDTIQCMNLLTDESAVSEIKLPSGPGVPAASLMKLQQSTWFIQLDRYMTVNATFTGSY